MHRTTPDRSTVAKECSAADPDFKATLTAEIEAILADVTFKRSPILSRLLRYLTERTAAGQGDRLKGYTVAVDGLARPTNFDAQLDSYPRVQMVRLRKALESHYAWHAPLAKNCVFLTAGSYRVRMAAPSVAYPQLFPATVSPATEPVVLADTSASVRANNVALTVPMWSTLVIAVFAGICSWLAATTLLRTSWDAGPDGVADQMRVPTIAVAARPGPNEATTRAAASVIVDGLRRSWVARVRDETAGVSPGSSAAPDYRLALRVVDGRVDAQLTDARSSTVVWTESAPVGNQPKAEALANLIARIAGPFGTIARIETARRRGGDRSSYGCILTYFNFVKTRDATARGNLAECLVRPADDTRLAPALDAVRAYTTLESQAWTDREAQITTAGQFARRSVEQDGEDAYAQFAVARIAYLRGHCTAANFHADRAALANPFDVYVITLLAALATQCEHPNAAAFLDQAFRIRSENDNALRGLLTFATIALGQEARLVDMGDAIRPPDGPQLSNYLLTETMVAASQGRHDDAALHWKEFRATTPTNSDSDEAHLRTVITADQLRQRFLKVLIAKGVIPAA